ncbi:MAG TPA: phosphoenolpyruvate carboxykinase [archaeon]|nr:phosphoenolpyruvate carboxykinase [archaeon]
MSEQEIVAAKPILERVLDMMKELDGKLNVTHPLHEELRWEAERYGTRTKFGSYNFVSSIKNRSAGLTVYFGGEEVLQPRPTQRQKEILRDTPKTVELIHAYLKRAPIVCVDRTMCENQYFNPHCKLYVSVHRKEMMRLAYMVGQTLFPLREGAPGPKFYLLYIPEWQEKDRQIIVFPEIGVTYVLGSDYYGEAKKGFLRLAMWFAKKENMLGVHAGAKIVKAKNREGKINRYSMILFGLSATGKTTHACHDHGLLGEGEGIEIAQDDVVFLREDGSALGSERGFYLKTGYLDPAIQPIVYRAAISPDTIFENVMVDYDGNVYFNDETLTGNGRAIIQRTDLRNNKSETVNLPPLSEVDGLIVIFITRRNTVVPICSKLTPEQGAAAFMLGESIETSAGDPRRAGESVREVGTNPFIVGDEAEEGNWFYDFVKRHRNKVQCYLLNTGGVGELMDEENGKKIVRQNVVRVEIPEMASIIRGIVKGSIEWQSEPYFDTIIPKKVNGVDMAKFDLARFYTQEKIDDFVKKLKTERMTWLNGFKGLNPVIVNASPV